ncbi:Lysine-specific demethylase 4B [Frankliniella fusca]|uniref:Lysine-specific demethylase 4B n=1 Tax=Frankliniella fusca TaxID=407009 RepID=A0AAE1LFM7_9NEOP|nr:Lysine-specific demethylase 4B [Frankliniella fusca]
MRHRRARGPFQWDTKVYRNTTPREIKSLQWPLAALVFMFRSGYTQSCSTRHSDVVAAAAARLTAAHNKNNKRISDCHSSLTRGSNQTRPVAPVPTTGTRDGNTSAPGVPCAGQMQTRRARAGRFCSHAPRLAPAHERSLSHTRPHAAGRHS